MPIQRRPAPLWSSFWTPTAQRHCPHTHRVCHWYQLESAMEQPIILALAGTLPLPVSLWQQTPVAVPQPPFGIVTHTPQVVALTGMADFAGCPSSPGPADPSITGRNWHCRTHFARRGPPGYGLAGRTLLFGCRTGTHHLEVVAGTAGKSAFGAIDFGFASPPPVGPRTPHRTLANGRVEMTDARLGHFGARGPVRS